MSRSFVFEKLLRFVLVSVLASEASFASFWNFVQKSQDHLVTLSDPRKSRKKSVAITKYSKKTDAVQMSCLVLSGEKLPMCNIFSCQVRLGVGSLI